MNIFDYFKTKSAVHKHPFHSYPSTYIALIIWGTAGFMGQPTFASFMVHFFLMPLVLALTLWLAHWEGRSEVTGSETDARRQPAME